MSFATETEFVALDAACLGFLVARSLPSFGELVTFLTVGQFRTCFRHAWRCLSTCGHCFSTVDTVVPSVVSLADIWSVDVSTVTRAWIRGSPVSLCCMERWVCRCSSYILGTLLSWSLFAHRDKHHDRHQLLLPLSRPLLLTAQMPNKI